MEQILEDPLAAVDVVDRVVHHSRSLECGAEMTVAR